jgi:hypothetical protein
MPFIDDEIGMETAIAEQLDDIAAELNGIAERLRRKPFAAVERSLTTEYMRLGELRRAGRMTTQGQIDIAHRLLRRIKGEA